MAEATAQRIAEAAALLLHKDGAEGVTMRRVAAAVGLTPMALYRHFSDRDALLNVLADAGFAEVSEKLAQLRLTGPLERQLNRLLDVYLDFAFEKPRLFELMFLARRQGARVYPQDFKTRHSPTANVWADVIAHGMETGLFRKHDVWEIVFETGAMLQGLAMLYLGGRVGLSQRDFRSYCHRAFRRYVNGIRA